MHLMKKYHLPSHINQCTIRSICLSMGTPGLFMRDSITAFPKYDLYSTEELLYAYLMGPARLNAVIEGLTEDDLRTRARGQATWSVHEIVLHVTDSELQGVFRIRKVWSQPGADLSGYDQDAWARELAYQQSSEETRVEALQL